MNLWVRKMKNINDKIEKAKEFFECAISNVSEMLHDGERCLYFEEKKQLYDTLSLQNKLIEEFIDRELRLVAEIKHSQIFLKKQIASNTKVESRLQKISESQVLFLNNPQLACNHLLEGIGGQPLFVDDTGYFDDKCDICGDCHEPDSIPLSCQTGDGE